MSHLGSLTAKEVTKKVKAVAKERGVKVSEAKDILAAEFVDATNAVKDKAEHFILSYGMGVDSTSILLRCLDEGFEKFGIDESKLTVITAQTGNEFPDLGGMVEKHILPRLAERNIRFIQVAREKATESMVVLDDSRSPSVCYLNGAFTLRDELIAAGTIPQSGGTRKCSIKSKGWPLDLLIADITGGKPYLHIIGFESEETGRAVKDFYMGDDNRIPFYPLIEWGWNREKCLDYIESHTGVRWAKSACWFCPFFGQGVEKDYLESRWTDYPHLGADTLYLEHTTLALNPRQTLFGLKAAKDFVKARKLDAVLSEFDKVLASSEWVVYRVRRVWANGRATRGVEIEKRNLTENEAVAEVMDLAALEEAEVSTDKWGILRAVHSDKPEDGDGVEHFIVASPVSMKAAKFGRISKKKFDAKFEAASK